MSPSTAPVLVAERNQVGHLVLNRTANLNALTLPMVDLLHQQLKEWEKSSDIIAVVIRAAGEKAFCAGGDIRMLYESYASGSDAHMVFFEREYALDEYIHGYSKPVIALIDGLVFGGGMGLVQGASLRVVTERASLGMPETAIGFFPDVGASHFLSRLPGAIGKYLGIVGVRLDAADALYANLADTFIASSQISALDRALDTLVWPDQPMEALSALVKSLEAQERPPARMVTLQTAIDTCFDASDVPSIEAALAQEARPEFQQWATETIQAMKSRSPLAMAVTLELIIRGANRSLHQCFQLELRLARLWFEKGNFQEGVRALIIDKDMTPCWVPSSTAAVTPEAVAEFFADHPEHEAAYLATAHYKQ